ncbi:DUF2490 domain-containing protein [Mangrovimonas xylaniphaga]|uniref:DUF2490 domain-containing protein n=1 Tax=Mangrovimonas xylaniphaga TaxID=1645915 RepID=UPI0009EA9583|nr:DUF2490 domain-containing protein [Mangrovimonas xylaniphaga]
MAVYKCFLSKAKYFLCPSKLWLAVLFCCLYATTNLYAQTEEPQVEDTSDFTRQLWVDFRPYWNIGSNQRFTLEVGYRTVWPKHWHRFVTRLHYQYTTDTLLFKAFKHKETLYAGAGLFFLSSKRDINSLEIRPHQGYTFAFNWAPRFEFAQSIQLEERFMFTELDDDDVFGMRLRYKVKGTIGLEGVGFGEEQGFYVPLEIEFFFNLIKSTQFNDVIRITPGIGYKINKGFKIEANAAYHYTKYEVYERTNDIVFRLKVFKKF